MIEYDVIEGHFVTGVIRAVRAAIESGWEPLGGIAVTHTDSGESRYFYQAMIRTTRDHPPPSAPMPRPMKPPHPMAPPKLKPFGR